jgi:hypothetical protein
MTTRYIGSGPYCYANCLAMALGDGTDPGLMEVLTGSPFGMQLLGGHRPLFDPLGWDPETGIDAALSLLGWTCQRSQSTHPAMALQTLRAALADGPALVGPVEMGLLQHQPDLAPPGSLGGGEAALALAELVEMGLTDAQRDELVWFAVRLGARRLSDAQYWLARVWLTQAAEIAGKQSRLVGSLQYPLVTNDKAAAAKILRVLAPAYRQLAEALSA